MAKRAKRVGEGRPTDYRIEYCEQATKLCLLGCKDKELAKFFDIAESTLNVWKEKYPEFKESIENGRLNADVDVAKALYGNAIDRVVPKKKMVKLKRVEYDERGRKIKEEEYMQEVEEEEFVRADYRNTSLWLRNRQPKKWRDKTEVDHTTDGEKINTATSIVFSQGQNKNTDNQ